jgi:hypothetical protein
VVFARKAHRKAGIPVVFASASPSQAKNRSDKVSELVFHVPAVCLCLYGSQS